MNEVTKRKSDFIILSLQTNTFQDKEGNAISYQSTGECFIPEWCKKVKVSISKGGIKITFYE